MKFKVGDRVTKIVVGNRWSGADEVVYTIDAISPNGDVRLAETGDWLWDGHLDLYEPWPKSRPWACECGSESEGSSPRHAVWCPKWTKF